MKVPFSSKLMLRLAFVSLVITVLIAGLLPATRADMARTPLAANVTVYGNVNAAVDMVFSPDAIWGTNLVGLMRWDREGEYTDETRAVQTSTGESVALDPWQVRTDGVMVTNRRIEGLVVDGQGRLWSVGDQLALLDNLGQVVATARSDATWWLAQHYEALLHSIYPNPTALVVDPTTGWLWIRSPRAGVIAFDGAKLHDWRDQSLRPGRTFFASPQGEVWVSGPELAYRYLKGQDSWQEYHYAQDMGLPAFPWDQRIFGFDSDAQGRIWVRTSAGTARFDPATGAWQAFGSEQGVFGGTYAETLVDADGAVWTLTGWDNDQFIARLDEESGMFVQQAPLPRYFVDPDPVQDEPIVAQARQIGAMRKDLEGRVWILTEIGALHWNGEQWQVLRVTGPDMPAWLSSMVVANAPDLAEDPILFIGGSSKVRLADDAATWPIFAEHPFPFRDTPGLSLGALGADGKVYAVRARADLWTYNEGQVAEQPTGDWVELAPARIPDNANHPINTAIMTDLAVDADGTAWLGSQQGLYRWRDGEWQLYEARDGIPVHKGSRIVGTVVEQVELDEDGTVWLITASYLLQFDSYGGFLVRFDGETFETVSDLPIRYLGNTGETMRYDPVTGLLWLRDLRDLRAYDIAAGTWTVADLAPLGVSATLRDMAPTGDGGVWVVTGDGKLFRYQEGVFEALPLPPENPEAGRIGVDPQGNTWVTGLNGAASVWDGVAWQTFTAEAGVGGGLHRDMIFRDDEVWLLGQMSVDYRKGGGSWSPLRAPLSLEEPRLAPVTATVDADGVLWYVDGRGIARYADGQWQVVLTGTDIRGGEVLDIVKVPNGPLWIANRQFVGIFDGVEWTFATYGTSAPLIGFRTRSEWVDDIALGAVDSRVFFGATPFSFNLLMYSPNNTYWVRFPSTAELTHPVTDMELAPDGRLWFGSGRVAYLDERDYMWVPPGTIKVYSLPTVKRLSHGSRDIFWVLGADNVTGADNLLSRCNWFSCDWIFLEPSLRVNELVAASPNDAWLNGEGWLMHVQVGQPDLEPVGGYLRPEPTPTPVVPTSGGYTAYGGVHSGGLTLDDPFDQWTFSANGGDVVSLRVDTIKPGSTVGLYLFRADGTMIAYTIGDELLQLDNRELAYGDYIVQVQLESGAESTYTLYVYGP